MGYDEHLQYPSGRGAVVVVHGTAHHTLKTRPFDGQIYATALCLPVVSLGKCREHLEFGAKLFELEAGYNGISYAVTNTDHHKPLEFTLNCSGSKNLLSHRGSLDHTEIIPPNESRVLHHLMPDNEDESWELSLSIKYFLC
jgi:hypothetical protein